MIKKILFIDQYGYLGGGQRVLLDLISATRKCARQIALCIPCGGELERAARSIAGDGLTLLPISEIRATHGRKTRADLLKILAGNVLLFFRLMPSLLSSDIVYVNGGRFFLLGLMLACITRRKVCFHLHIEHKGIEVQLLKLIDRMPGTRALIANSQFVLDKLKVAAGSYSFRKLVLIENRLGDAFAEIPLRLMPPGAAITVVTPGVLRPEKGQDIIFRIAERFPLVRFEIVGRVGEGAEAWFADLLKHRPNNVRVHPATADLAGFIAEVDACICVVPSVWDEPFGLVAIEGMACSCLTLVSNRGGLPSIVQRCGGIVFDGEEDLACKLEVVIAMPREEFLTTIRSSHMNAQKIFGSHAFDERVAALLT